MERECKSIANWFYFDSQRINETDLSPDINLVFLFPFFWVQNSSYPKELASGGPKKWFKCSSYPRFELTSDFYKKVFGNLLGLQETASDNKSSSYPVFELPVVICSLKSFT